MPKLELNLNTSKYIASYAPCSARCKSHVKCASNTSIMLHEAEAVPPRVAIPFLNPNRIHFLSVDQKLYSRWRSSQFHILIHFTWKWPLFANASARILSKLWPTVRNQTLEGDGGTKHPSREWDKGMRLGFEAPCWRSSRFAFSREFWVSSSLPISPTLWHATHSPVSKIRASQLLVMLQVSKQLWRPPSFKHLLVLPRLRPGVGHSAVVSCSVSSSDSVKYLSRDWGSLLRPSTLSWNSRWFGPPLFWSSSLLWQLGLCLRLLQSDSDSSITAQMYAMCLVERRGRCWMREMAVIVSPFEEFFVVWRVLWRQRFEDLYRTSAKFVIGKILALSARVVHILSSATSSKDFFELNLNSVLDCGWIERSLGMSFSLDYWYEQWKMILLSRQFFMTCK